MCLLFCFLSVFSRASGLSDFIISIRAGVGVAKSAGRGLHVHVGGASETLQEGIRSLRLFNQTLLSPFSESHHHTYYPVKYLPSLLYGEHMITSLFTKMNT